jgi:hypothetical protein
VLNIVMVVLRWSEKPEVKSNQQPLDDGGVECRRKGKKVATGLAVEVRALKHDRQRN